MNLFEKLNRLDDSKSLAESTKIITKKKLTESTNRVKLEVKYETYGRYGDGGDIKTGRVSGSTEVEALMRMLDHLQMYTDSDYAEEFKEENGRYPTTEEVTDVLYQQNGDGCDLIYWIRNLTTGEMIFDGAVEESEPEEWDDDMDEMLTESTEQYELSTLVKDSINHLVNDLGKDLMANDFGDDVCADLENNYDIYVPQNPVKYADWCSAVKCEVSRQLNNREELTESCNYRVKRYGQWHWGIIGPDELLVRQDNGKLLLFKSKDKAVAYIDTLCKNNLTEGNNVSSQLPPAIDDFLQDIAQMYRTITYKDIMEHKYTEDDLKKLRNYRRRFRAESPYEGDEEADAILNDIAEKVAFIIKR